VGPDRSLRPEGCDGGVCDIQAVGYFAPGLDSIGVLEVGLFACNVALDSSVRGEVLTDGVQARRSSECVSSMSCLPAGGKAMVCSRMSSIAAARNCASISVDEVSLSSEDKCWHYRTRIREV
jgi:hypothetical protein